MKSSVNSIFINLTPRFILGFVTVCTLLVSTLPSSHAAVLVNSNFETGVAFDHGWSKSGNEPKVVNTISCEGKRSAKISLDYNNDRVKYRTEWALTRPPTPIGPYKDPGNFKNTKGEYWFGFAIFVPNNFKLTDSYPDIVMQFHGAPDKHLNELSRNPPLSLFISKNEWRYRSRWSSEKVTPRVNGNFKYTGSTAGSLGTVQKGKWTSFVWHITFSPYNNGLLEIWKNGQKLVSKVTGNTYNDVIGPYLKMGNYKPRWIAAPSEGISSRLHYIDSIRIGDSRSSYKEVAPRCGNSTAPIANDEPVSQTPISQQPTQPSKTWILDVQVSD